MPRTRSREQRAFGRRPACGSEHAHAALVEEPVEQPLGRRWSGSVSSPGPRRCRRGRGTSTPGVVLGSLVRGCGVGRAVGPVAGVEVDAERHAGPARRAGTARGCPPARQCVRGGLAGADGSSARRRRGCTSRRDLLGLLGNSGRAAASSVVAVERRRCPGSGWVPAPWSTVSASMPLAPAAGRRCRAARRLRAALGEHGRRRSGRRRAASPAWRSRRRAGRPARRWSVAPRHQASTAFCACSRFSASSKTTEFGPSMTSSVTSSPRCAGRQCMNRASGLACHQVGIDLIGSRTRCGRGRDAPVCPSTPSSR
jgi:hypothetical protein